MSNHYLLYWKLKTVEYRYYGEAVYHIAHDQLKRVEPGDIIWIVTVRGGDLLLAGRVRVGIVMDADAAAHVIDEMALWDAAWHVFAADDTAEPMQLVNLTQMQVTLSLRFQSESDRLRLDHRGRLKTMSLYSMRLLTDESGALLTYVWNGACEIREVVEQVDIEGDHFIYLEGQPVVQQTITRRRNRKLIAAAKARFMEEYGDLRCSICDMSFAEVYGELGAGYIEVHHPEPLAAREMEQFTHLDDLVLVCANCHRMIHRKHPPYSVEELRGAVQRRKHIESDH